MCLPIATLMSSADASCEEVRGSPSAGRRDCYRPVDHYVIPGDVEHLVEATDDGCQTLDIWSPIREEYISDSVQFFSK